MRPVRFLVAVLLASGLAAVPAFAQHDHSMSDKDHSMSDKDHDESAPGHSHAMSEVHGGHSIMTPQHHFEMLFTKDAAKLYVYDGEQKPVPDLKDMKATMTLMHKGGKDEPMEMTYVAPDPEKGRTQGYFEADHDFSGTEEGSMKAMIHMQGLTKEPIEFRTPVEMGMEVMYACPMKCVQDAEDPGSCPKCGMTMVPMEGHEGHEMMDHEMMDHDEEGGHGMHDHGGNR